MCYLLSTKNYTECFACVFFFNTHYDSDTQFWYTGISPHIKEFLDTSWVSHSSTQFRSSKLRAQSYEIAPDFGHQSQAQVVTCASDSGYSHNLLFGPIHLLEWLTELKRNI